MGDQEVQKLQNEKDDKRLSKNPKNKKKSFLRRGSRAFASGAANLANRIGSAAHVKKEPDNVSESSSSRDMPYENLLDQLKLRYASDDAETVDETAESFRHWRRNFPRQYTYLSLYRFASRLDKFHMILGIITALLAGICIPMIIYFFGRMVRTMVIVEKIKQSIDCNKQPARRACEDFLAICKNKRPFNRSIDKPLLNEITHATMNFFSLWVAVVAAGYTICSSIYFICWNVAADNQIGRLRMKYFEALLRKDRTWFDTQTDPESVNKLMDHTRRIHEGIGENIPIALNLLTVVVLCISLAFSISWALTSLALGFVLVLLLISYILTIVESKRMIAELRAFKYSNDLASEVFANAKTMIVYGGQRKEIIRFKKELNREFGKVTNWSFAQACVIFVYWVITFLAWGVVMWFGIANVLVVPHDLTCILSSSPYYVLDAGDMFISIFSILLGVGNIRLIPPVIRAMHIARDFGNKVFRIIDGPRGIDSMGEEGITIQDFEGSVEFQDVRFTYPLNKENVVLNHFSMKVSPCSHVAIVGINGCGKSSVLKLITKEYIPDSGFIKIDGEDIRNLNTNWLRSQIGYVPQNPMIFDDTVENNVRMGKQDAASFEIHEACRRANVHDFILSLVHSYKTRIGAGGIKLTIGQQQRIAIARALIRNPKILLLDEHTSSLDPESESLILDTIQKVSTERTVIMVTHHLQSTVNCSQIFVMKRGKIVEQGTHNHLLKNKGPYNQLASGLIDKPSVPVKGTSSIPDFDGTLINLSYLTILFDVQRGFPSLYNSRLTINSAVLHTSQAFMKHIIVSNIHMQSMNRPVEEEFYVLESADSIEENDSVLTKSEYDFREFAKRGAGDLHHVDVTNPPLPDTEVEGIKEILDLTKYTPTQVIRLAWKASYKIVLLVCVVLSILMALVLPTFAVLIGRVVEIISNPSLSFHLDNWEIIGLFRSKDPQVQLVIMFVFLGIGAGFAAGIQEFCINMSGYKMTLYLKKKVFAGIIRQDMSFFDNPTFNVAALKNLLSIDVLALRYLARSLFNVIPQMSTTLIAAAIIGVAVYAANLAAYAFLLALLVIAVNFVDSWFARKQRMTNATAMNSISSLIWEVFEGKHDVTITQLEPYFLEKFSDIHNTAFKVRRRITYLRAVTFGLSQTSIYWGYAAFIFIASHEITSGRADFIDTIAIGQLLIFGLIFVGTSLAVIPCFKLAIDAGRNILQITTRIPRIPTEVGGAHIDCDGSIGFHDVHFKHPCSEGEHPCLRGVTFTVPAGKTVGIVGYAESGKSLYVDLIMRLFDVPNGNITLDGKDIKDFKVRSLRRLIGYVEHEPKLFKRTVAENIAYGDNKHKLQLNDIIDAAEKAHMHNYICSLPDGYDTRIGAPNERLSTAHKQRICIARAILKGPKILLIDEPTNDLDREGEKLVLESLEKVNTKDMTCIIVAHRLQTVKDADLIVMMKDGLVSETGTHEDLLKNGNGDYANLWKSQNPLEDERFANAKDPIPSTKQPLGSDKQSLMVPPSLTSSTAPESTSMARKSVETVGTKNPEESKTESSSNLPSQSTESDVDDSKSEDKKEERSWLMCGSFGAR